MPKPSDHGLFKIEAVGIQKLSPGRSFRCTVKFSCPSDVEVIQGALYFLTYDPRVPEYHQFCLQIVVLPPHSDLEVAPLDIDFGKIPYWRARGRRSGVSKPIMVRSCFALLAINLSYCR